jgi:hypothetical protein
MIPKVMEVITKRIVNIPGTNMNYIAELNFKRKIYQCIVVSLT